MPSSPAPASDPALADLGPVLRKVAQGETLTETEAADTFALIMSGAASDAQVGALLMGMRAPPNPGAEYRQAFDAIYPSLAKEHGAALVPFFLEPVWDKPELIQQDRVHPTAKGIEALVAATVDEVADALPDDD